MSKETKFVVGGRVRVYSDGRVFNDEIERVDESARCLTVKRLPLNWFNFEQCRRLVKRERRRIWLTLGDDIFTVGEPNKAFVSTYPVDGWLEFVEARR